MRLQAGSSTQSIITIMKPSTTARRSRTGGVRVITTLPQGYREINHRGKHYYQSGDQYYRRQGNGYIVVGSPY